MEDKLIEHYSSRPEIDRLTMRSGLLEAARTQELLLRYLPEGATVLDVGGGDGFYAEWLARRGHPVQLLDAVPLHVEEARRRAGQPPLFDAQVGDARRLPFEDGCFDAVLVLGPLYHLVQREERVLALREAARVCAPGGFVLAAAISRLAPALDGIGNGWIVDEHKFETVLLQLAEGASGDREPGFPAISYFHHAEELAQEAREARLDVQGVLGIEGPAGFLPDLETRWGDRVMRERILWLARTLETEPVGLAMSGHLLLVARA
ncbi:MAG: class I SAM-dependent methyltransferase [Actinobacteria bacterium]|nr:class I SAM-dependent methyltransferase [Actinomycetota bacterium]